MRLITEPTLVHTVGIETPDIISTEVTNVQIWAPRDEQGRIWEKLRTGDDAQLEIGIFFGELVFGNTTLYGVQVLSEGDGDIFICKVQDFIIEHDIKSLWDIINDANN